MIISRIIEDAAGIAAFRAVKAGTAANGVIAPTATTDECLGVVMGRDNNQTFDQNDNVSVACAGEIVLVEAGATLTAQSNCTVTVGGLAVACGTITTIAAALSQYRLGITQASAVPGDLVEIEVKSDHIPINP